jgi:hypothetical protein
MRFEKLKDVRIHDCDFFKGISRRSAENRLKKQNVPDQPALF